MCTPDKNLKLCTCSGSIDKAQPYWYLSKPYSGPNDFVSALKKQRRELTKKMKEWEKALESKEGYSPSFYEVKSVIQNREKDLLDFLMEGQRKLQALARNNVPAACGSIAWQKPTNQENHILKLINTTNCFDFAYKPKFGDILTLHIFSDVLSYEYSADSWHLYQQMSFSSPQMVTTASGCIEYT